MRRVRQLSEVHRDLGDLLRAGALDPYRVQLVVEVHATSAANSPPSHGGSTAPKPRAPSP